MSAIFGPAGNAESFSAVHKSSLAAPRWIADLGLDCYEYQCGKGVHVGEETARKVGENARAAGISLSLHAPYFINLANPDREALEKTIGYITGACRVADWMGGGAGGHPLRRPDEAHPAPGAGHRHGLPAGGAGRL